MIAIPEGKELELIEQKTNDVVSTATALIIDSQERYDKCADFLKAIKGLKKTVDDTFDTNIKKAHQLHKDLVATKKIHYEPLDRAEAIIKSKTLTWVKEKEQERLEAQRKIDEEARREEERKRKIKEEQEKAWREKEEAAEKEAERLEAEGKGEEATKAREAAEKAAEKAEERAEEAEQVHVPRSIVQDTFEKAEGQSIRQTWSAEVTDMKALCKAISDGVLPETMVKPDIKNLNALARTMKDSKAYPGLKFKAEDSLAQRG